LQFNNIDAIAIGHSDGGGAEHKRNAKVLQEFSPFRALDAPLTVVSTMIRRTFKGATVAEDSEQLHVPKSDAPLS
jgi:hypothetical protein